MGRMLWGWQIFNHKSGLALGAVICCIFLFNACISQPEIDEIEMSYSDDKLIGIYQLNDNWEFYWGKLLDPEEIDHTEINPYHVKLPDSWTTFSDLNGNTFPAHGDATFRYRLDLKKRTTNLGLFIPKIWCANKTWVNGNLVGERGSLGKENYKNLILEKLVLLEPSSKLDVVIQISNYSLFNSGIIEPIKIGDYNLLNQQKQTNGALNIFWIGCVFVIGLYHFLLYSSRKDFLSLLYFGIICLLIIVKLSVFGNHFIYEFLKNGILNFKWQSTLYYISTYMLAAVGLYYIKSLYPQETSLKITRIFGIIISLYCLFVLLTPVKLFSPTIFPFQAVILLCGAYIIYVLIRAFLSKRREANIQLVGIVIMIIASINDALDEFGIDITNQHEMVPIAFAALLIFQIIVIGKRFTHTYAELQDEVTERTKQISMQKEKIAEQNMMLKEKNETLAQLNSEKDNLMNVVAHDLKAPFNKIRGLLNIVQTLSEPNAEVQECLGMIEKVSDSGEKLIKNLLDINTIESDDQELEVKELNLGDILDQLSKAYQLQASNKEIKLASTIDDHEILTLETNENYLLRIMDNLISNALKFSKNKTTVVLKAGKYTENELFISIKDEGPGFTDEDKRLLFKKFQQLSAKPTGGESSTGLGLAIIKILVEKLNGKITLDSTPGEGSTFTLTLPGKTG
ncbi:sensor histidine kinase [Fulvivirgaceae bacterium BMA10]|uniref:histidine kinase n=1 Tax=Splendidivirga corallicola TaxID=3051826 RepID=A0ABT8KK18_9BACT|nr:sensor histidine kinase [Fulvivirgaceae bacterium BMA10]